MTCSIIASGIPIFGRSCRGNDENGKSVDTSKKSDGRCEPHFTSDQHQNLRIFPLYDRSFGYHVKNKCLVWRGNLKVYEIDELRKRLAAACAKTAGGEDAEKRCKVLVNHLKMLRDNIAARPKSGCDGELLSIPVVVAALVGLFHYVFKGAKRTPPGPPPQSPTGNPFGKPIARLVESPGTSDARSLSPEGQENVATAALIMGMGAAISAASTKVGGYIDQAGEKVGDVASAIPLICAAGALIVFAVLTKNPEMAKAAVPLILTGEMPGPRPEKIVVKDSQGRRRVGYIDPVQKNPLL